MSQYNNPYYLATGDGGVSQATVVPDFTSIPNSENFLINSNLGDTLNFRQSLNLKDNFLENLQKQEYPIASTENVSTSSVEFQFSLPGYVHCRDIIMNWRFLMTQGQDFDIAFPDSAYMTPFVMLNLLDYYEITLGNNSFLVGRPEFTNDLMAIKTYLSTKWSSEEELISRGVLGSPVSQFIDTTTMSNPDWNYYSKMEWNNMWKFATARGVGNFYLDVPVALSSLSPFFDQNAYLPEMLKMKIKLVFKFGANLTSAYILSKAAQLGSGDIVPNIRRAISHASAPLTSDFFVTYNYKILKDVYSSAFNAMMLEKDLLYNYFNMRTFRTQCKTNVFNYDIPITWSKQRPSELYFTLEYGDTSSVDTTLYGFNPTLVNSAQGFCGGFYIQLLEVYANGQLISRFRNRGVDQIINAGVNGLYTTVIPSFSAYDMLQNLNFARMSKQNTYDTMTLTSDTLLLNQIMPVRILLDPSMDYNSNMRSLDKGTTNMRVSLILVPIKRFVTDPVNWLANWSKYSLTFRFKEAAQIAIDAQQNIQEIDWPCVRADSKKYLNATISSINAN